MLGLDPYTIAAIPATLYFKDRDDANDPEEPSHASKARLAAPPPKLGMSGNETKPIRPSLPPAYQIQMRFGQPKSAKNALFSSTLCVCAK
jgi:hypothetical protein